MGSVKDLVVLKKPTPGEAGTGNFIFSGPLFGLRLGRDA